MVGSVGSLWVTVTTTFEQVVIRGGDAGHSPEYAERSR